MPDPVLHETALRVSRWDYAVIALYLAGTLGIGFWCRRRAGRSMEDFFLGGRRLPGWANGCSQAAAFLNSDVAPAYIAWTVGTGLFVCWLYISRFGFALMIAGVLFAVFWRKLKLFTAPEFYGLRFPGRIGAAVQTWVAVRSSFVAIVAWSGVGLLGMAKVAEPVFGWSKVETISILVPAVLLYVFISGYLGVVFTDVFQTLVMVIAGLVLCGIVLFEFHGPRELFAQVARAGGMEMLASLPPLGHDELGLVVLVAWLVGTSLGYGGDVAPMSNSLEGQRIFSSRNGREAAKMYVWTVVVLFVLLLMVTLPGLAAVARWPELHTASRVAREGAFGRLLVTYMPPGLLGLQLAALMAALMSTLSANFNFGAQVATNDLYRRLIQPHASDRHYLRVGRAILFLVCGLSVWVALEAESMITVAIFMLGLSSAECAANWAQWWWWRFNAPGRLAASFGGPLVFLLVRFGLTPWLESRGGPVLTEWDQVLLGIALTTLLWVTVTLLTKPQDEKALIEFYRRCRPLGWWEPIRRRLNLPASTSDRGLIARGFGIAALGAIWTAGAALAASNAFLGQYGKVLGFAAGAGLVAVWFFRLFPKHLDALTARVGED